MCILLQFHLPLPVHLLCISFALPHAQPHPTVRSLARFQEKVFSIKAEGTLIVYMQPLPKTGYIQLDLTLGLPFVMGSSLSCPCDSYYDYPQPEGKCLGGERIVSLLLQPNFLNWSKASNPSLTQPPGPKLPVLMLASYCC